MRKKDNVIPKVLIIAGSDSGGGAGVQADVKVCNFLNVHACTAITSITAQNTLGVQDIFDLPCSIVESQLQSVISDIAPAVIKLGMLSSPDIIKTISPFLNGCIVITDPVMTAKGGARLLQAAALEALFTEVFPKTVLLTPNIPEAYILLGKKAHSSIKLTKKDLQALAKEVAQKTKVPNVLLKGGHLDSNDLIDVLYVNEMPPDKREFSLFIEAKRIDSKNTHGTGCTYASLIAAMIAKWQADHVEKEEGDKGYLELELPNIIKEAHSILYRAIANAPQNIGAGHGSLGAL